MITKVFANGQVWDLWGGEDGSDYINTKGTHVADVCSLELFEDFEVLVQEHPSQRTETPVPQEISSKQGDCIANKVHSLCVELQLMYSYLPATDEFLVDYDDTTFKLKYLGDIGKLRHMISLMEELGCE